MTLNQGDREFIARKAIEIAIEFAQEASKSMSPADVATAQMALSAAQLILAADTQYLLVQGMDTFERATGRRIMFLGRADMLFLRS